MKISFITSLALVYQPSLAIKIAEVTDRLHSPDTAEQLLQTDASIESEVDAEQFMKMQRLFSSKVAEMKQVMDKVKERAGPIIKGMQIAETQRRQEEARRLAMEEQERLRKQYKPPPIPPPPQPVYPPPMPVAYPPPPPPPYVPPPMVPVILPTPPPPLPMEPYVFEPYD